MLQFGLDRFLELLEERFGRWTSTLFVGVSAVCILMILVGIAWTTAVEPLAAQLREITDGVTIDWRGLAENAFAVGLAISILLLITVLLLAGFLMLVLRGLLQQVVEARAEAMRAQGLAEKVAGWMDALNRISF